MFFLNFIIFLCTFDKTKLSIIFTSYWLKNRIIFSFQLLFKTLMFQVGMFDPDSILDFKVVYMRISNQPNDWVLAEASIGKLVALLFECFCF